jgi:hypothetical protein
METFDMENITLRDLRAAIRNLREGPNSIPSIARREGIALDELGAAESYLMGKNLGFKPIDPREVLVRLGYEW